MKESQNTIRPLRIGSAAVREAGLCPAVAATKNRGSAPGSGFAQQVRNEEELR
jgi:hypothetical protein